jgi:hypothetical protein
MSMSELPSDLPAAGPEPAELVDMSPELERIRTATYQGRDPDHLVTAVVDGEGIVVRIQFATMVGTHAPAAVENAVLIAVAAAQDRLEDAWRELTARLDPAQPEPTPADDAHGGIELVFEPAPDEQGEAHGSA